MRTFSLPFSGLSREFLVVPLYPQGARRIRKAVKPPTATQNTTQASFVDTNQPPHCRYSVAAVGRLHIFGASVPVSVSITACHCEPVLTLVWQSVPLAPLLRGLSRSDWGIYPAIKRFCRNLEKIPKVVNLSTPASATMSMVSLTSPFTVTTISPSFCPASTGASTFSARFS